jgi:hypothetical protein
VRALQYDASAMATMANLEIFDSIVATLTVDMVDCFGSAERAPKHTCHHEAVL